MADTITPAERAAIDAALAAGRVTRLPTGASSETSWAWCDRARQLVNRQAVHLDPGQRRAVALAVQKQAAAQRSRAAGPTQATRDRRARVAEMFHAGRSGQEMADVLGVPLGTVWNDLSKLGLSVRRRDAGKGRKGTQP